jgi:hypothetical protein
MALSFMPSSTMTLDVVVTCDPAVTATPEQASAYLDSGDLGKLGGHEGATMFTLKALSPQEREEAEVRAGAYTRSELGRMLWVESPDEPRAKALWHHSLSDDEKGALASYQAYINRVFNEMVRASLIMIDERPVTKDSNPLEDIRPEAHRVQVIAELVRHVQRMSLLGQSGK